MLSLQSMADDFFDRVFNIGGNGYNLKQKHLTIQLPGGNPKTFINGEIPGTMPDTHYHQKQNKSYLSVGHLKTGLQ